MLRGTEACGLAKRTPPTEFTAPFVMVTLDCVSAGPSASPEKVPEFTGSYWPKKSVLISEKSNVVVIGSEELTVVAAVGKPKDKKNSGNRLLLDMLKTS